MIQKKIGFGEKLSFLLANVGNFPIMTLISAYLMIFYTDIVGLNPGNHEAIAINEELRLRRENA
jgi:Na+/melibiose symporter-like transporter